MINLMHRKAWEPLSLFIPFLNHGGKEEGTELTMEKKSTKVKNTQSSDMNFF